MSDPDVVTEAPNLVSLLRESMVSGVPRGTLRERGLGVLIGLAAGNLLGLPVEGDSRPGTASPYPSGVKEIRTIERRMPMDDDWRRRWTWERRSRALETTWTSLPPV